MKKLAILGLGHIGSHVYHTLKGDATFEVHGFDLSTGHDLRDQDELHRIISGVDGVLASTPYYLNCGIAAACAESSVDYFDLTESLEVRDFVATLDGGACFVTQCGLAPGMVGIIAADLARGLLDNGCTVEDISVRVGALPTTPSNPLGYYRTWNTEGLINEYIHPCPGIKDGALHNYQPVEDIEVVHFNGKTLEAANTSGGSGSLPSTFNGTAKNLTYKTLRYPGHWSHIQFLKRDLGLKENFQTFVDLFNRNIPQTTKDVVYIYISATGKRLDGTLEVREYNKEITHSSGATAIQIATAYGAMAVLDCWCKGGLNGRSGWISQESLDHGLVWGSRYAQPYK